MAGRYVAFLGGINVGGHRVKGERLGAVFEAIGHTGVSTFLASGNVIFDAAGRPSAPRLRDALEAELGYPVPVFLRTAAAVRAIATAHPLDPAEVATSAGKHQVVLLARAPRPEVQEQVRAMSTEDDRLAFGRRELHWLPAGRMSDSELDLRAIERLVGPSTIRTMNTIERIVGRYLC